MPRVLKENSITKKILVYLGETSKELLILGAQMMFTPNDLMRGVSLYGSPTPLVRKRIDYLKRSRYFTFQDNRFYLTPRGRIEIIKIVISKKKAARGRWDGKWRGVIFDIPEMNSRDRAFLRKELRWMGFQELQKSVWVFPYDIQKELRTLLAMWQMDLRGDIRFLVIDFIDDDTDLKKRFRIR